MAALRRVHVLTPDAVTACRRARLSKPPWRPLVLPSNCGWTRCARARRCFAATGRCPGRFAGRSRPRRRSLRAAAATRCGRRASDAAVRRRPCGRAGRRAACGAWRCGSDTASRGRFYRLAVFGECSARSSAETSTPAAAPSSTCRTTRRSPAPSANPTAGSVRSPPNARGPFTTTFPSQRRSVRLLAGRESQRSVQRCDAAAQRLDVLPDLRLFAALVLVQVGLRARAAGIPAGREAPPRSRSTGRRAARGRAARESPTDRRRRSSSVMSRACGKEYIWT